MAGKSERRRDAIAALGGIASPGDKANRGSEPVRSDGPQAAATGGSAPSATSATSASSDTAAGHQSQDPALSQGAGHPSESIASAGAPDASVSAATTDPAAPTGRTASTGKTAPEGSTGPAPTGAADSQPPASPAQLKVTTGQPKMPAGLKVILVAALATVACFGLNQIQDIVAPAFFALTLVLTVRPIHRWLMVKGVPAWLSAVVTITTLVVVLLAVVGLMVWSLVGLPDLVRGYAPAFQNLVQQVLDFMDRQGLQTDQITSGFLDRLDFGQAVSTLTNVVNSLSSIGTLVVMVALSLLFITVDTQLLARRSHVVENHDSTLFAALSSFEGRVRQYWLVSTVFGLIVAVFNWGALQFLDVPLPVAWALFSFITNYIPNIGFVIGVIPPALLGLLDSGWLTAVWVIVAYCVFNAVIQGVFQPKFTGDAVGLSTTVTFLSLVFWTFVIGPLGAILAVPLTLFAKALLVDSSLQTRWMEAFLIPESEARKREEEGYYNEESPARETFIDLTAEESEERKKIQRTLRSLSLRSLRAKTENK